MNYYIHVLKNYAVFRGRARRREYWMFVLINTIVYLALMAIDSALGTTVGTGDEKVHVITTFYAIAVLVPGIAVSVRRLHDTSRSGWFMLLALIPIVGSIILIVLECLDSTPGPNKYGPNPKGIGNPAMTIPSDTPVPPPSQNV